jgi:trans-aconitate 2-methyltransferase
MIFEFDGEKYRQASTHQKEWGARLISEFDLRGDERILDLGSGDGVLTAKLAELVPAGFVLGIDASSGMIEAANEIQRPNLGFKKIDVLDMDFEDEFDIAFSNATLHWVKDHRRLLTKVRKALRTNGILRFNFAGDGNCSHFFKVVRETMARGGFARSFDSFEWPWYMPTVEEYRALLDGASFAEAEVWSENADRFFKNIEEMVGWVDQPSLVPLLVCLEGDTKTGFRDEVVRQMIEETIQPDGTCFETFRRIHVLAKK